MKATPLQIFKGGRGGRGRPQLSFIPAAGTLLPSPLLPLPLLPPPPPSLPPPSHHLLLLLLLLHPIATLRPSAAVATQCPTASPTPPHHLRRRLIHWGFLLLHSHCHSLALEAAATATAASAIPFKLPFQFPSFNSTSFTLIPSAA